MRKIIQIVRGLNGQNDISQSRWSRAVAESLENRRLLANIPIVSGQTLTGAISTGGQTVSYSYVATTGQSFDVSLGVADANSSFQPQISVYNPSGTLLYNNYTSSSHTSVSETVGPTSTVTGSTVPPGTYTIVVQAYSASNTGTYALELDAAPANQASDSDGDGGVAISSGQTKLGAINRPGDLDVYTFTTTSAQSFDVSLGVADANSSFQPQLSVYSPNGVLLRNTFTSSSHTAVSTVIGPTSTVSGSTVPPGTYTIIVQAYSGSNTGTYALELDAASATQAVDSNGDGGGISSGQTKFGTINRPGDLDVYTFTATTAQSFQASLGVADANSVFQPHISIYNPNGVLLVDNYTSSTHTSVNASVGVTSTVSGSNTPPGTYTIIVQAYSGSNTGAYALELDASPATQAADTDGDGGVAISSGQTKTGSIGRPGDIDVYMFTATTAQSFDVSLGVSDANSAFQPQISVYNPNGVLLFNNFTSTSHSAVSSTVGPTSSVVNSNVPPGTYTIIVQAYSGSNTGTYALELDAAPATQASDVDGDGGLTISSGQTKFGSISRPGDLDVYTFAGSAGQSFEVSLGVSDANTAFQPHVSVYNPNGLLLSDNYTSSLHSSVTSSVGVISTVSGSTVPPGIYTIIVQSYSGTNTGAYALELAAAPADQAADADGDSGTIVSGQARAGNLNRPGDLDVYTFFASAGGSFNISETVSGTLSASLTVYSPSGALFASNSGSTSTSVSGASLSRSGFYTLIVQSGNSTGTGSYALNGTASVGTHNPAWLAPDSGASYTLNNNTLTVTSGAVSLIGDASSTNPGLALVLSGSARVYFDSTEHLGSVTLNSGTSAITVANGTFVESMTGLSIASTAVLDVSNNALILDYSGTTPGNTLRGFLASGRNGGDWNGSTGIISSAVSGMASSTLGYGEASSILGPTGGTFAGQTVDGTALLVRFTYLGDANLNRTVDAADFVSLSNNFGRTGAAWNQGDFDYDGDVDAADFVLLSNNFGKALTIPTAAAAKTVSAVVPTKTIKKTA